MEKSIGSPIFQMRFSQQTVDPLKDQVIGGFSILVGFAWAT
jgi:hypothetical protein